MFGNILRYVKEISKIHKIQCITFAQSKSPLWIFLKSDYGSPALQYFSHVCIQEKLPTCCQPTPHWMQEPHLRLRLLQSEEDMGEEFTVLTFVVGSTFTINTIIHCPVKDYSKTQVAGFTGKFKTFLQIFADTFKVNVHF